jgi:hypothetical protein
VPAQKPGAGARRRSAPAARLPRTRSCSSGRNFRIRLVPPARGDRIRSATVTLDGRRVRVLRGRRLHSAIDLRGLPRGTFRLTVTVRTARGRTLRSARTYRTCARRAR